jgi:hypothetical protein
MTGEIIQFSTARPVRSSSGGPSGPCDSRRAPLPEPLTETCRNQRLRNARKDAWHRASAVQDYRHALLKWETALSTAQSHGVTEAMAHDKVDCNRSTLVAEWRAALVTQLLTPAPDMGAVIWKRTQLASGKIVYCDVKPEKVERAIADDVAFLEAHPTRRR